MCVCSYTAEPRSHKHSSLLAYGSTVILLCEAYGRCREGGRRVEDGTKKEEA